MKKTLTIIAAFCIATAALAQERQTTGTTENQADSTLTGDNLMNINTENGDFKIEVAGFGITLGPSGTWADSTKRTNTSITLLNIDLNKGENKPKKKDPVVSLTCLDMYDFGFNVLTDLNYSGAWAGQGDFLDMIPGRSNRFAMNLAGINVRLDKKRKVEFDAGLRFISENYRFRGDYRLANVNNSLMPAVITDNLKKSKITANYLTLPLTFTFNPAKNLSIAAEGSVGMLIKANSKYVCKKSGESWQKNKEKNLPGFNQFKASVGASITYGCIGLFCDYSLTPLFKSTTGAGDAKTLSFGLRFDL